MWNQKAIKLTNEFMSIENKEVAVGIRRNKW